MHGRVDTIFCIPMVIQSRLISITERIDLCISFLQVNSLSIAKHSIKEEPNMYIFYFDCLATNLLDFLLKNYFALLW